MGKYETYSKLCLQCNEVLVTTSKREKVHAACRQKFYLNYQKTRYRLKTKMEISNASKNIKKYWVNDQPCASCGFSLLTKKKELVNNVSGQLEEYHICPNCLALWKCGMLELSSWKHLNAVAPEAPDA